MAKKETASSAINDDSTKKVASLLHFAIYEARNAQLFHRLRIGVRDVGAFSELLALALKDYIRLKEEDEFRDAAQAFRPPSQDDIKTAQNFFQENPKQYIRILLAEASAPCFKGRCRGEGG